MPTTDYERYIRTDELLALQKRPEELVHPDELLFQVIHQTFELWFKVCLGDVSEICRHLGEGRVQRAAHLLRRIALTLGVLTEQLGVLETMAPADYHVIRLALGRGSGQDSPGFNRMLRIGEPLWAAFRGALERQPVTLAQIHERPDDHYELFLLVQGLMELDERFVRWRFCHFQLVRRVIGEDVKSLKGIPAAQLALGMREYLFPELWAVINEITRAANPKY
ncbi:MAG: tryptophan 2,3-dioxygenase family protein [Deltaproteobacteria bacterium]